MKNSNMSKLLGVILVFVSIIVTPVYAGERLEVTPSNSSFKSYMDYRTISTSSKQGELQEHAVTDSNGLRTLYGRYMVAVGPYYATKCGINIDVELSSGVKLACIVGDLKQAKHTVNNGKQAKNGNIIEFIVDTKVLDQTAKKMGDISKITGFEGDVVQMTIYDSEPTEKDIQKAIEDIEKDSIETVEVKEDVKDDVIPEPEPVEEPKPEVIPEPVVVPDPEPVQEPVNDIITVSDNNQDNIEEEVSTEDVTDIKGLSEDEQEVVIKYVSYLVLDYKRPKGEDVNFTGIHDKSLG